MMPEMDGIEVLGKLKTMENPNREVPVVVLTANAIAGIKDIYIQKGFAEYLSKPIEIKTLESIICKFIPKEKIIYTDEHSAVENAAESKEQEQSKSYKNFMAEKQANEEKLNSADLSFIDTEKGLNYSNNDKEIYKEILEVYCDEFSENKEKLNKFKNDEDWKNYTILAHAIKGTSLTIGAQNFSNFAKQMELAGKEEHYGEIVSNHERFINSYNELVQTAVKLSKEF